MDRRKLRIRGGGDIRISRDWLDTLLEGSNANSSPEPDRTRQGNDAPAEDGSISLGADVIERAEIITEGVFRPGVEDVEVKYLLSGRLPDSIDRLHQLASDRIISEATPHSITTNVDQMIEFVRKSGTGQAGVIVDLHTHPTSGMAQPSDTDLKSWREAARLFEREFPAVRLLFGVHGVGRQEPSFVERVPPRPAGVNQVIWRSNTREHGMALFAADSTPVAVRFRG